MHASLLSLLLAPLALASPILSRADKQTCFSTTSAVKSWELKSFDFHANYIFSTPSHQNSWGYVSFVLENAILGTKTKCEASSSSLNDFFYGDVDYQCEAPEGDVPKDEPRLSQTTFRFDRPGGEVQVAQSWYCFDDPQFPSTITAKGGESVKLDCEETYTENSNWTIGEIYSQRDITCGIVDLTVPVKEISAVA
ncbi:conserved hypothetical protein [Verticillium alfalfae VaMs.102]|uniref:AA1-like domain-containing protein n=1 Tax=Verticillium alfalfae (strain VaMs.102 / ATCC MYA-4576 / FGSC 10136) TaxID=526221 RepID=C9SU01_VERA1|nr:conserved hypothetical protein [Verticillium alfalfae VaMs.102]EEY22312.1 conserved hypothetical protein [Verticillium alfalfae VaMs.102]